MKFTRNYVTPFISLMFLVVGISGVLMFFHLFDGYTEIVHEYLGMFFVLCAIFHIMLNWKALRSHFKKAVFVPAALGVLAVSVLFIVLERMYPPVDMVLINRLVRSPIVDAFQALGVDYAEAAGKLKAKGIAIDGAATIEAIWIRNDASPEEVIDLIME